MFCYGLPVPQIQKEADTHMYMYMCTHTLILKETVLIFTCTRFHRSVWEWDNTCWKFTLHKIQTLTASWWPANAARYRGVRPYWPLLFGLAWRDSKKLEKNIHIDSVKVNKTSLGVQSSNYRNHKWWCIYIYIQLNSICTAKVSQAAAFETIPFCCITQHMSTSM